MEAKLRPRRMVLALAGIMKYQILILLTVSLASIAYSEDPKPIEDPVTEALASLKKGMTKEQVLEIMKPVSLDWGIIPIGGGTGVSIYYFQVSETEQQPILMNGHPNWDFSSVLMKEPKRKWIRHEIDDWIYFPSDEPKKSKRLTVEEFLSDDRPTKL